MIPADHPYDQRHTPNEGPGTTIAPDSPDLSSLIATSEPVFISHSSRDADTAKLITDALELAGIRCWLAPRDIPPSSNWNSAIMTGINASRAFVLLFSRHSVESEPVTREVERAVARRIPVLPVRLEMVAPSPALEFLISTFQWVDAFPPPINRHLEAVTAAVKRLLDLAHEAPRKDPNAPPKYVGPYRVLEPLGEGGMGTVYKAVQQTPLKRAVAIKLIKPGLATNEVLARFETERQALARMDNPHIAKVFDAGADDFGRPFFVMEYVPGVPITQFADDNKLSIQQRLVLFMQVCDAIAHAHTKSLIHRDVKASNVLAYMADGKPIAKVIDFGIAKALTGDRLTDRTFSTERGLAIGSYEAMSPEQADGSPDIDTRTDVYSLGVLLYELLAGVKPLEPQTLRKSADAEVRRIIREVEPQRPSVRLSSLGEASTNAANARRSHPSALASQLRSELEWIPLMAMRKDRQRRYASPLELSEDIQNYLQNRPLKAGPESVGYRLRKGIRRNRTAIVIVGTFVALIALSTTTYIYGIRTEQEKTAAALQIVTEQKGKTEAALTELREQQGKTDAALILVQDQKQKVEGALKETQEQKKKTDNALEAEQKQAEVATAVNDFLLGILAQSDLDENLTVVEAVQAAVKNLDEGELKTQPYVEARLRLTIGRTLRKLGRDDESKLNLQRAVELYRELPGGAALHIRGVSDKAVGATRQGNEFLFGKYELAEALDELALLCSGQKKYAEAEALASEALELVKKGVYGAKNKAACARVIAEILEAQGKLPEAEAAYKEAIELASEHLPNLIVDVAILMNDLGYVLQSQRKFPEAERMYRDALNWAHQGVKFETATGEKQFAGSNDTVARSLRNVAAVLYHQQKFADAEPVYRELLEFERKTLPSGHADIARTLWTLGVVLREEGKQTDAKSLQREALNISRKAFPPGHPLLLLCLNNLGIESFNEGKFDDAEALLGEKLGMLRNTRKPDDPELLTAISTLGFVFFRQGKSAEAEPLWREALQLGKKLLPANDPQLAVYRLRLVQTLMSQMKHTEAEPLLRETLQTQIDSPNTDPVEIRDTLSSLGNALEGMDRLDEAEKTLRETIERGRKAWPKGDAKLATVLDNMGLFLQRRHRLPEAEKFHNEALEMYRKNLPEGHPDIGISLNNLALLRVGQGDFRDAEGLLTESLMIMRNALPVEEPTRTQVLVGLVAIMEKQKRNDEAEKLLREELATAREKLGIKAAPTASLAGALADMLERTGQKDKAAEIHVDYGLTPGKTNPAAP